VGWFIPFYLLHALLEHSHVSLLPISITTGVLVHEDTCRT